MLAVIVLAANGLRPRASMPVFPNLPKYQKLNPNDMAVMTTANR